MGGITKSLAELIATATAGIPASTDLLVFSPLPNTPLVTQAKKCTVAELIPGVGLDIPAKEIVFGTGTGVSSSPLLTFDSGATTEPKLVLGVGGLGNEAGLYVHQTGVSDFYDAGLYVDITYAPASDNGRAWAIDAAISADSARPIDKVIGANISAASVGAGLTGTLAALQIQTNAGTVTDNIGLLISNISSGVNNYAIKTGTGAVEFGDVVKAAGYKSSDGTAGETAVILAAGLVSITVKNGLVTAHA